jgi:tetratricopeptide (TPR) repeat protein
LARLVNIPSPGGVDMTWANAAATKAETQIELRELKDKACEALRRRRYDLAAGFYRRLGELDPSDGGYPVKLGDALQRLGCKRTAIESYRAATSAYARLGDVPKAMAACQLVLRLQPDDPDTLQKIVDLRGERRFGVPLPQAMLPNLTATPLAPPSLRPTERSRATGKAIELEIDNAD